MRRKPKRTLSRGELANRESRDYAKWLMDRTPPKKQFVLAPGIDAHRVAESFCPVINHWHKVIQCGHGGSWIDVNWLD